MTKTSFFGSDDPIAAAALPTNSAGLSWHNVQRQRLAKFARQYLTVPPRPVVVLRSQGEPDIGAPEVAASRSGFTQLRRDLPVMDQYFEYSGDTACLARIKQLCLAWARTNSPDGKPINESNLEWLVRVMKRRQGDFSAAEWASVEAWLLSLRAAKEAFAFETNENEGAVRHGNWYTHHYKVLLLTLDALGDAAAISLLLDEIDGFADRNFPFGGSAVVYPASFAVVGTSAGGQRFDIGGDHVARFAPGTGFVVAGNSQGNDGAYTVAAVQYLVTSNKTRVATVEAVAADGGGGTLREAFDQSIHDMPRAATTAGESIDYIRRDALHYQVYDLAPWVEIGLLTGQRYRAIIEAGYSFFVGKLLSAVKHYEFAATTDRFDAARWAASHPEYLAPEAMFKPQRAAGMMLSYHHYRAAVDPDHVEPGVEVALCLRAGDTLASLWAQYFRWALGYGADA